MLHKLHKSTLVTLGLWLAALVASTCIPLAALSGSFRFILSGINIVLPIAGGLFGLGIVCSLVSSLWIFKLLFVGLPITIGIPSAFAMLSWGASTQKNRISHALNFIVNVLIPAACMAIFMLHPASSAAWPYALYWLIPIAIWASNRTNNSLLIALQSTFIAHAVGSIMWVFLVPMTSSQWIALIAVVAVERCGIALLATGLYKFILAASARIAQKPATTTQV